MMSTMELDAALERMNLLCRTSQEAVEAANAGVAEVARLSLLKLAETMPGLGGLAYSTDYEYDDEGSYFRTVTVYPLEEGSYGDFDDEFSDDMSAFGVEALALLCGVSEDAVEGQVTLAEAQERRF